MSSGRSSAELTPGALSELAGGRARVYRALALSYAKPIDGELWGLLRPWALLPGGFPWEALPPVMRQGLEKMAAWLEKPPPDSEALLPLEAEFTRLFRGLSRLHSPPPPYESVYLDGGLLYGPSTAQVSRDYRRFGLQGRDDEPPDHISPELDFMGFLCEGEARARRDGGGAGDWLKEQGSFLREHLARWAPSFCENILREDPAGFYGGLAQVTQGWLSLDQAIIEGLLEGGGCSPG